MRNKFNTFL